MSGIDDRVCRVVADVARRPASDVSPDSRLAEDLLIKSANRVELSILVEDEFGIKVSLFDILKAKTVSDVAALVAARGAGS